MRNLLTILILTLFSQSSWACKQTAFHGSLTDFDFLIKFLAKENKSSTSNQAPVIAAYKLSHNLIAVEVGNNVKDCKVEVYTFSSTDSCERTFGLANLKKSYQCAHAYK